MVGELEDFRTELPLLVISLIGKALKKGITIEVTENDLSDMLVTFSDSHTGKSVTLNLGTAGPDDLDEVEFFVNGDSLNYG